MPLNTIEDLVSESNENIALLTAWASDLSDMYEDFVKKDEDDVSFTAGWHSAKGRSDGIHASELSGGCRRPVYYSLTQVKRVEKELDPFWKKRFRVGHLYHALLQEDLRRMCEKSGGLLRFDREVRIDPSLQAVSKEYNIKSSCDGVISFHDHPYGPAMLRVAIEIKTESPDQFKDLKEPKPEHRRQTCVYMKCLNTPLCWTFYINKGNQNIKPSKHPFLFHFDHDLWRTIETETRDVIRLATIQEVPPRKESIVCEFCGYSEICQPPSLFKKKARDEAKKKRATLQTRMRKGLRAPGAK